MESEKRKKKKKLYMYIHTYNERARVYEFVVLMKGKEIYNHTPSYAQ